MTAAPGARFLSLLMGGMLLAAAAFGNDSTYYTSGNQLAPLQETDITVEKEVLTMRRCEGNRLAVTVDYTFRNPGKEARTVLMGFEAPAPHGEVVDVTPRPSGHPYLENFTATINGGPLDCKVAIYDASRRELERNLTEARLDGMKEIPESGKYVPGIRYVYYFTAIFAPGFNTVRHTYAFKISSAVYHDTQIEYLLTPALRWANRRIDDFTLVLDLGEMQEYHIEAEFFSSAQEWQCGGKTLARMEHVENAMTMEMKRVLTVWQKDGPVTFHAKNFQPKGEFSLFSNAWTFLPRVISADGLRLPFEGLIMIHEGASLRDEFTRRVLLNLPYARRGHVFRDEQLRAWYATQPWYAPNEKVGEIKLTERDVEWRKEVAAVPLIKSSN